MGRFRFRLPVLLLLCTVAVVVSALPRVWIVSAVGNGSGSGSGGGDSTRVCGLSPDAPCRTIQSAVDNAADGDTIRVLADGVYTNCTADPIEGSNMVYVNKTLSFVGVNVNVNLGSGGAIIDCDGIGRAFHFVDVAVQLEGL